MQRAWGAVYCLRQSAPSSGGSDYRNLSHYLNTFSLRISFEIFSAITGGLFCVFLCIAVACNRAHVTQFLQFVNKASCNYDS